MYFYRRCRTYEQYQRFTRFLSYAPRHRQIEFLNHIDKEIHFPLIRIEEDIRNEYLEDGILVKSPEIDQIVTQSLDVPVSGTHMDNFDTSVEVEEFPLAYTDDYVNHNEEMQLAHVVNYLAKPLRVASTTFSSTNIVGDNLYTTPDTWTIPSLSNTWLDKLRGFQGLRATLCIKVVCAANAYSAGKLRLFYYPGGDDNLRKQTIHTANRNPASQLPGVDINMQDPIGVLKIPYKTQLQYYQMTENSVSWGSLFLQVFSPYRTGPDNQTSIPVVVWAWLEDVVLYGQTHPGIVTQGLDQPLVPTDSNDESKPISGFFGNTSKALVSLSGIPFLKSYLATPIWALNALKGLASSLGYSKPNKAMLFYRNAIGSLQNMANSDGERAGNSLSLLSDATLAPIMDLSRDGCDEASINYIKQQWACYNSFTITTASTVGSILYTRFPGPLESSLQVSPTEVYYSPIAYLGRLFKIWRGGITYRLEFIKTPLHKGELMVTFQCGPNVVPTVATAQYLYREIVDLSTCDSIEFTVPYFNALEWLESAIPSGRLDVFLINTLQAPETVATTIDVLVYVKGHESLQFAIPGVPFNMSPYVTQSLSAPRKHFTQSYAEPVSKLVHLQKGFIGGATQNDMSVGFNVRCVSEIITSLLQLAKRHAVFDNSVLTPLQPFWVINPFTLPCTSVGSQNGFSFVLSTLSAPFAFIRGGVDLNITTTTAGAFPQIVRYADDGSTYMTYAASPSTNQNAVTICNNVNGGILVNAPFYCVNRAYPVRYTNNPLTEGMNFDRPRGTVTFDFTTAASVVSRGIADDFQFLFFVGIPRMAGSF